MVTRSVLAAGAAVALVFALVGCTSTPSDPEATTGGDTESSAPAEETPAEETPTSAVPTLTDAPAVEGPTMAMSADSISPDTLTIAVGDVVTFTSGDGGLHGLVINGLSSVTVGENLPEYYLFTEAGTYLVSDDLSTETATITVN